MACKIFIPVHKLLLAKTLAGCHITAYKKTLCRMARYYEGPYPVQ